MQLPVFHIISLVVCFSLVTWKPNCDARVYGNQQDNTVFYLCGAKFKQVWERCCDHGCAPSASKRTLHGLAMSTEKANGFLDSVWKRNRMSGGRKANALDECCTKACTIEEVAEYSC